MQSRLIERSEREGDGITRDARLVPRRRSITLAVMAGMAAAGLVPSAAQGAAGSRAAPFDLAVARAKQTVRPVAPTGRVLLSATVKNLGKRGAGASELRFVLTRARRPRDRDGLLRAGVAVRRV